ncbi:MAG: hypothetical protein IPH35_05935 [Rhodoferax sp.]|nr:hypothetical protein [Rhodoferax sp.]
MTRTYRKPAFSSPQCPQGRLACVLAVAALTWNVCIGTAQAQTQAQNHGSGLTGDVSYTLGNGSNGYASHSLAANIEHAALPLSLGLDATQSTLNGVETSMQANMTLGWSPSPVWSFAAHLSTMNDDLVKVNGRGLSVGANLHKFWQGRRTTHLELERDLNDYSAPNASAALNDRIPNQGRTRLDIRQGVNDALDVYWGLELYDYSSDPVDMARALLLRKVRRVTMAGKLGDLLDRSQTVGVSWSMTDAWNMDVSFSPSRTVIGQNQQQKTIALSYMFLPKASVSFAYSDSSSDALTGPNGAKLAAAQTDSTLELGLRWSF